MKSIGIKNEKGFVEMVTIGSDRYYFLMGYNAGKIENCNFKTQREILIERISKSLLEMDYFDLLNVKRFIDNK